MRVTIIGGTGDLGEGLVKRLALKNEVVVGSRNREKALELAQKFKNDIMDQTGFDASIDGEQNETAVKETDAAILAVPYQFALQTAEQVFPTIDREAVFISPVVPMAKTVQGFEYTPSAPKEAIALLLSKSSPVPVAAAFHTLPAQKLANLRLALEMDVPVCSDDQRATETVFHLAKDIPNLRPLIVGGLALSYLVESLTPLILNVSVKNRMHDLSLRFV
jgi:NADPH-dependent F420 reductase